MCMRALVPDNFITLGGRHLESISLSDMLNLRGVSEHIDCQWQLSCSGLWEFVVPDSNGIIFKTKNFFLILLFHFWNLYQILNILKKMMILKATLFRKLNTVKELVRPLFERDHLRNHFDNQHIKGSQTLVKSESEQFYQILSWLLETLIWKVSPLVIC